MVVFTKCVICGSTHNLHNFPKEHNKKRKWAEVVDKKVECINDKKDRVCSVHFTEDQFKHKNKKRLIDEAVPTLFLDRNTQNNPELTFEDDRDRGNHVLRAIENESNVYKKTCYICGYVASKSFHRIPRNYRERWPDFEKVKSTDRLCNRCFLNPEISFRDNSHNSNEMKDVEMEKESNVIRSASHTSEMNTCANNYNSETVNEVESESNDLRNSEINTWNENINVDTIMNAVEVENNDLVMCSQSTNSPMECSSQNAKESSMTTPETPIRQPVVSTPTSKSVDNEVLQNCTQAKRRYFRYFGDIKEQDVETPRRAKLALKMGREEIGKIRQELRTVRIENSRLKNRIVNLEQQLSEAERKSLITRQASQNILVNPATDLFYKKLIY